MVDTSAILKNNAVMLSKLDSFSSKQGAVNKNYDKWPIDLCIEPLTLTM